MAAPDQNKRRFYRHIYCLHQGPEEQHGPNSTCTYILKTEHRTLECIIRLLDLACAGGLWEGGGGKQTLKREAGRKRGRREHLTERTETWRQERRAYGVAGGPLLSSGDKWSRLPARTWEAHPRGRPSDGAQTPLASRNGAT